MRLARGWQRAVKGQLCTVFLSPDKPPCARPAIVIRPGKDGEYSGRCYECAIGGPIERVRGASA